MTTLKRPRPRFANPCLVLFGSAILLTLVGLAAKGNAQDQSQPNPSSKVTTLEDRVTAILSANCGSCHQDSDDGGIDYITQLPKLIQRRKVVVGKPDASRIWLRINDAADPMPPESETERLSEADKQCVEEWIRSLSPPADLPGADVPDSQFRKTQPKKVSNPPEPEERKRVLTTDIIASIHHFLSKMDESDRHFQRFFTLNHLHNMPTADADPDRGLGVNQLNQTRAAVSKTVNSLSWSPDIIVPRPIDDQKTVMAIDLRDLQWNENRRLGSPDLWNILLQEYPYAMKHDRFPDSASSPQRAKDIYQWTGIDYPWIRADWFVATATQPHFYHAMLFDAVYPNIRQREPQEVDHADAKRRLEQPMTADDLYDILRVDLTGNLRRGRVARAGFTRSGVSSQPRLLERVSASYGYLWGSYDFKRGNETMNLNARPLGPVGAFNERFRDQAFKHDGGEIIFGLPNGLHGYLLITDAGDRIPLGPVDIVEDRAKTLGNGIIVNGLSCIACHKQGLIEDFRDEVRYGISGLPIDARQIARKLYLDRPELDRLIGRDQARYRTALIESIAPFVDAKTRTSMEQDGNLIEPIGPVGRRFLVATLDLTTVSRELGIDDGQLASAIPLHYGLQRLGLAALKDGGTTNREIWQSGSGMSMYQKAAQILKLGTPGSFQAPPWRGR